MTDQYVPPSYPLGPERHDAGGSKRWPLQPGVRGDAIFGGPADCYRFALKREWGAPSIDGGFKRFALCIGMNPSTAEKDIDDPTIRAEMDFTRALNLESYVKTNVGAYRATFPDDLKTAGVELCPPENIATILDFAESADFIIAAWGKLPKVLKRDGDTILFRLGSLGKPIWCFGKTADGSPRHPLYVARSTPLERFR